MSAALSQPLLEAREAISRRARSAHPRVRPLHRLMVRFCDHAITSAQPTDVPELLASLRSIYRAAAMLQAELEPRG